MPLPMPACKASGSNWFILANSITVRLIDSIEKKVARLGAKLAADDIFIHALISRNANVVERGLVVLSDAHFEVDGVAVDVHFNRVEVVE